MANWHNRIIDRVAQGKPLSFRDRVFRKRRNYARELEEFADLFSYSAEPAEPPQELKDKTLAAIDALTQPRVVPAGSRRFRQVQPGIEVSTLSSGRTHRSMILRLQRGSTLPAHKHAGLEHAMVIAGSCYSGSVLLNAGDYLLSPAGSTHEPVRALEDCVLLVIEQY